jgi:hypothetical protein
MIAINSVTPKSAAEQDKLTSLFQIDFNLDKSAAIFYHQVPRYVSKLLFGEKSQNC